MYYGPPTTLTQYSDAVYQNQVLQYATISAVAVIVWDWITSLDDEVAFIWSMRSKVSGRPLYLLIRYVGLAFELYNLTQQMGTWNRTFCTWFYALLPIGSLASLYMADVLLAYRALCLWRMNRLLLFTTCGFFLAVLCSSVILVGFSVAHYEIGTPLLYTRGCVAVNPITNFIAPVPAFLFEIWIVVVVIVRASRYAKKARSEKLSENAVALVRLVTGDALWWFIFVSLLLVVNSVVFAVGPPGAHALFLPFTRVSVIIMGCRFIIRMRKAAVHNQSAGLPWRASAADDEAASQRSTDMNEAVRIDHVLDVARRFGLPPALRDDFQSMWFDEVRTINRVASRPATPDAAIGQRDLTVERDMEMRPLPFGRR